jgi:hypothetical protein
MSVVSEAARRNEEYVTLSETRNAMLRESVTQEGHFVGDLTSPAG